MTEFAAYDALAIRAGMEALEAARHAAWKRPPSNLCECGGPDTHLHRYGARVCSGCLKPKLGVF